MRALEYPWSTIETKCRVIAARASTSKAYRRDLLHIAADCRAAADGCDASAQSVDSWLDSDGHLSGELAYDEEVLPTASESKSAWGMANAA